MSMREQGDALEKYVKRLMDDHEIVGGVTAGSGAVKSDGDLHTKLCAFECKTQHERRGKVVKNLELRIDEFDKIEHQAITIGKEPVLVLENAQKRRFAIMDLDQFMQLIAKVEHAEG